MGCAEHYRPRMQADALAPGHLVIGKNKGASPVWRAAAAALESGGPSFKEIENGQF